MKLLRFILKPLSFFGTPLKGDTLFGHFCWQVVHEPSIVNGGISEIVDSYETSPVCIFSSAYPCINDGDETQVFVKRPITSAMWSSKSPESSKEEKRKNWMKLDSSLLLDLEQAEFVSGIKKEGAASHKEDFWLSTEIQHNSIDRRVFRTNGAEFAPFSQTSECLNPKYNLAVFVLYDESRLTKANIVIAVTNIGQFGFGRDASTGFGRFKVESADDIGVPSFELANAAYTLSPCLPTDSEAKGIYYRPFVRFGRHGDTYATSSCVFKNPVLLADEGATLVLKDIPERWNELADALAADESDNCVLKEITKPYVGQAIKGVSLREETLMQGYSICLPVRGRMEG